MATIAHQSDSYNFPNKMQNPPGRLQPKSLCGPFDAQFSRKFRGKKSHSLSV